MTASCNYFGFLAIATFAVLFAGGGQILQDPSSQLVLPDDKAVFNCTVQTNGDYYIYISDYPLDPDDLPGGVTICISDPPNAQDVHVITVVIVATLDLNETTVLCAIDQYDGGAVSPIAYLWIAARPLPPNPALMQINATTIFLSWMPPFTHPVAGVLNYTVRMFNASSHQWKSWTTSASLPNTSSCHQADISGDVVHGCIDSLYRSNAKASHDGFQIFFVTKVLPDFNCDKLLFYVSARNVLGETESAGIKGMFAVEPPEIKLHFSQNVTTSSNDSLTVSWDLLAMHTGDYNLSVVLSDGQTANVPRGTLNHTFVGLTSDTCYNVSVAAISCSGVGLPASRILCTAANPPTIVSVSIIVEQDTLLPVQLQVVWFYNSGNSEGISYSVEINNVNVQVVSRNYVTWPILGAVPPYVVVSVSSVSRAGKGPAGQSVNISGAILNTDIVNATLSHSTEIHCTFSALHSHHCIVCCNIDPSVPPDSSVYNISSTNGTDVTVALTGLIAGQVYHCKVAATDDRKANCFSPVHRNVQTLIQIYTEQVSPSSIKYRPVQSPSVIWPSLENRTAYLVVSTPFSMLIIISAVTVFVIMFAIAAALIIIKRKKVHEHCACKADTEAVTVVLHSMNAPSVKRGLNE